MTQQDTLFRRFEQVARQHPDDTALVVEQRELSYAELAELVERLAGSLVAAAGGGAPRAVGILASRSLAAYAGYLAALRLSAVVIPLGCSFPAARNRLISTSAGVDVLIADEAGMETAEQVAGDGPATVVELLSGWPERLPRHPVPDYAGQSADVAYTLFTSGSTGVPKGVPVRHRNLTPYLDHMIERYQVGPGSRLSQAFELTFDPSVFDLFVSWCSGAALVVPQAGEIFTPVRFINDNRITHWFSVPSVVSLAKRLRLLRPDCMPQLRYSMFAGEQLTLDQARAWLTAAPHSVVDNLYGPTELVITCTEYRLPADPDSWPRTSNGTVPLGAAYPHLEAVLLDPDGSPTQDGELCVRGPQRFEGYLNPAENESRFVEYSADGTPARPVTGLPDPAHWYRTGDRVAIEDGAYVHLGRLDDQVKIHGYRIELAEIESLIRRHPGVHDVVVLALPAEGGELGLSALYISDEEVQEIELAELITSRLPGYMAPARYLRVETFPLTSSGKVDRRRLAAEAATG